MITGLRFKKIVNIELDKFNKITVNDERIGIKEVPYVRYTFNAYTEDELKFIKKMQKTFPHSVHILDLSIDATADIELDVINGALPNICIFGIYTIDDSTQGNYDAIIDGLSSFKGIDSVEKIILKDNTSYLYTDSFKQLEKEVYKKLGIRGLGLCNSPITSELTCCISAEYSRNLAAKYGDDNTANAVQTHQNTCSGCACVRYIEILENIVPKTSNSKSQDKTTNSSGGAKKDKAPAKPKISNVPDCWF